MGWIGRHKRHGIVLALLALAVQMIVAFGHAHLRGSAQQATAAIAQRTAAVANSQTPLHIPADNDDYCAACASIFLASTAFTPAPPLLPLPAVSARAEHNCNAVAALTQRQYLAFRSRAPPAV
ncbi:MAG: hypothetical protein ACTHJS_13005 [Xanthobacteraceae bacterium]|jgi:hypothetical protein